MTYKIWLTKIDLIKIFRLHTFCVHSLFYVLLCVRYCCILLFLFRYHYEKDGKYEKDGEREKDGDEEHKTNQLDDDQLEKILLQMECENKKKMKSEIEVSSASKTNSKHDANEPPNVEKSDTDQSESVVEKESIDNGQSNDTIKIERNISDQPGSIAPMEIDKYTNAKGTMEKNSQSDKTLENINQSSLKELTNDQSEADTETADEEMPFENDVKYKVENEHLYFMEQNDPLCKFGKLPKLSIEGLTQKEIISRFELLLEVERVENEIEQRVGELNGYLDGKLI